MTLRRIPPIIWMFIGVLLFELSSILSMSFSAANYIKMLGVSITIFAFFRAPKRPVPSAIKHASIVMVVIILLMVIRGSVIGNIPVGINGSIYQIIRHFLVYKHSAFAIMFPLVLFVDFSVLELKYYKSLAIVASIFSLFLLLYYKDYIFTTSIIKGLSDLEVNGEFISIRELSHSIFIGLGFILCIGFAYNYLHSKLALLIPITLFFYFISQVMGGGRGGSVMAFGYLVLFFAIAYQSFKNDIIIGKRLLIIIMLCLFVCLIIYLYKKTDLFDYLLYRAFEGGEIGTGLKESSREEFVDAFVSDFDNHPLCWLFGRGVNGAYRLSSGEMRSAMEWGYLWLILKGGIVYFLAYIYLLIKPAILGIFRSNNQLSKSFAVLCIIQVLSLIPFGVPAVSTLFLLTWHGARLISDPQFRRLSDEEIDLMINSK